MWSLVKKYLLPQKDFSPQNPSTNLITNYIVNPYLCNPNNAGKEYIGEPVNRFIMFLIRLGY